MRHDKGVIQNVWSLYLSWKLEGCKNAIMAVANNTGLRPKQVEGIIRWNDPSVDVIRGYHEYENLTLSRIAELSKRSLVRIKEIVQGTECTPVEITEPFVPCGEKGIENNLSSNRVLVIGDVHEPVSHPLYLQFCLDIYEKYNCNRVVFIGDIVDHHAISFHSHHPNCPGPEDEYNQALEKIQRWYKAFPKATVCIGNHDCRIFRLAESVNIPAFYVRDYSVVWQTPGWNWVFDIMIDNVYYYHGTGTSGINPAFNSARQRLISVVMGHTHSAAGVKWIAGPNKRIFGCDIGCGINTHAYQFDYGKHMNKRPILGCATILDGVPYHEIMQIGPGEKYSKRKS